MSAGAAAVRDDAAIPGRSVISARAYEQLVKAVGGQALAVRARDTSVRISDSGGRLLIEISGPVSGDRMPVLERIDRARTLVAERTAELTGAAVDRVTVHVTDIVFDDRRTS